MSNLILQESASSQSIKPPLPRQDRDRLLQNVGPSPTMVHMNKILKMKSKYQTGGSRRSEQKLV